MKRVLVLGLDGLDPLIAEGMMEAGDLPALASLRARGAYGRVATTAPAQTPVAWSTVATGVNPGGHGIFDFLRRDPATYRPEIALHAYEQKSAFLPPRVVNLRRGPTLWDALGEAGVPAVVLRHPCTYPPDKLKGRMIGGVGVPDLRGGFGTATVYTTAAGVEEGEGERVVRVEPDEGERTVRTFLPGPLLGGGEEARLDLEIVLGAGADDAVGFRAGGGEVAVRPGQWSGPLPVKFRLGALQSARGEVRFHVASTGDPVVLYASPVNFDPDAPVFPISHPWDYAGELRREIGPYRTLGMAEDHNGLINGRIDEAAFLDQAGSVFEERRAMLRHELQRFREGLLFCVFDTPDRVQHMLWRFREPDHPANAEHGFDARFADAVDEHYRACDRVIAEALEAAGDDTLVMVLSDHGFAGFRREVDLNAWLLREGLLVLEGGAVPGDAEVADAVDWDRTRAFATGLAGLWLNVRGREAHGVVEPEDAPGLRRSIAEALTDLPDPEVGEVAVRRAWSRDDIYAGAYAAEAPDVVVGCARGWRVASGCALGGVGERVFTDNTRRWAGDHVMDPEVVPGVLFASRPASLEGARLEDVAPTILGALGVPAPESLEGRSLLA